MAKQTPAEKLDAEIARILEEYADDLSGNVREAVTAIAKAGVSALKQESRQRFGGEGEYAKAWRAEINNGRMSTSAVIYNGISGLPHLLESGHAKRGGGRVEGRPHIAPVEEQITEQFQREVEKAVSGGG